MALLGRGRSNFNAEVLLSLVVIIVVLIVWVSGYYSSQAWRSPQLLEKVGIEDVEYNGSALAASIKNLGEAPVKVSAVYLSGSNGDAIAAGTLLNPIYINPGEAKQVSLQIPSNASLKLNTAYTVKVAVSWAIENILPSHLQYFILGRSVGKSVEIPYTFLWQSSAAIAGRDLGNGVKSGKVYSIIEDGLNVTYVNVSVPRGRMTTFNPVLNVSGPGVSAKLFAESIQGSYAGQLDATITLGGNTQVVVSKGTITQQTGTPATITTGQTSLSLQVYVGCGAPHGVEVANISTWLYFNHSTAKAWQKIVWVINEHSVRYRVPVIINNTLNAKNLSDYQVLVTLNTARLINDGKMRPDCGDIRFNDTDGTPLSYWIEPNTCNTQNTKIWVKVPSIPGGSKKTIYMYYGDFCATPISNPFRTMFIYEDFEKPPAGVLDGSAKYSSTGKWVELTPAEMWESGYLCYARVPTNPTGFYAKFYFSAGGGDGADAVWLGAYDSNYVKTREDIVNGGYHFTFDEYQDRIAFTKSTYDNGDPIAYASQSKIDDGRWHLAEVYFWYNGTAACAKIYYDGTLKVHACDLNVQLNVVKGQGLIVFGGRTGRYYNWHRVGGPLYIVKYTSPEPTVKIGPEIGP